MRTSRERFTVRMVSGATGACFRAGPPTLVLPKIADCYDFKPSVVGLVAVGWLKGPTHHPWSHRTILTVKRSPRIFRIMTAVLLLQSQTPRLMSPFQQPCASCCLCTPCTCCTVAHAHTCCPLHTPCTGCVVAHAHTCRSLHTPCTGCVVAHADRCRSLHSPCTGCVRGRARTSCAHAAPSGQAALVVRS